MLQRSIDEAVGASPSVEWSIAIREPSGRLLAGRDAGDALATASVGKLLLLVEIARRRCDGALHGATLLRRRPDHAVGDSGLWQHLGVDALSIDDLSVLVASVSDNVATNVLLEHVGLQSVWTLSESLGLDRTALHDFVRDRRGPSHPECLSVGSAGELSFLMSQLARGELISADVSALLDAWLATGMDTSMVASAFGLDPLAHATPDRDVYVRNKTGTDAGVRADVGNIGYRDRWLSYAVIANWDVAGPDRRDPVLTTMRDIGALLRGALENGSAGH